MRRSNVLFVQKIITSAKSWPVVMHVEIVSADNWPEARKLMVESLADLPFYKSIEEDRERRHQYFSHYLESEFAFYRETGAGTFVLIKADDEDLGIEELMDQDEAASSKHTVMALTIRFPEGCIMKTGFSTQDFSTLNRITDCVVTFEGKSQQKDESLLWNTFPDTCERMQDYRKWFLSFYEVSKILPIMMEGENRLTVTRTDAVF